MEVIEFQNEAHIKSALKNCDWGAGKFLYSLIEENKRDIGTQLGWLKEKIYPMFSFAVFFSQFKIVF